MINTNIISKRGTNIRKRGQIDKMCMRYEPQ